MNHKQANAVKKLAPRVIKVLEGLDVECTRCAGDGIKLSGGYCPRCNGEKKLHYSWTPQVGEWCIWKDKPYLIFEVEENLGAPDIGFKDVRIAAPYDFHYVMRKSLTPILNWQEIEEILEKAGYKVKTVRVLTKKYFCSIEDRNGNHILVHYAGTSQEAVMMAVIELGKEI